MSFVCPDCSRAFGSQRGLTLHRRRAHEGVFHAENLPKQRVRARWDPEALCMLANLEISLDERPPGDRRGINQILIEHHPGRTLESIKCVRKSQRYRDLIRELRNQSSAAPAVARTPDPDETLATEASTGVADLLELLRDTPCDPISLGLPDLVPGNPSQRVLERIDTEYLEWQPPRPTRPSHPPPHPRRDLPTRPRARRQAMYARVQSDYKRNR